MTQRHEYAKPLGNGGWETTQEPASLSASQRHTNELGARSSRFMSGAAGLSWGNCGLPATTGSATWVTNDDPTEPFFRIGFGEESSSQLALAAPEPMMRRSA